MFFYATNYYEIRLRKLFFLFLYYIIVIIIVQFLLLCAFAILYEYMVTCKYKTLKKKGCAFRNIGYFKNIVVFVLLSSLAFFYQIVLLFYS